MRCKTLCRPCSKHDQIGLQSVCNSQDLLCWCALLDAASGLAPELRPGRNELTQLAHFGINDLARRYKFSRLPVFDYVQKYQVRLVFLS
jgi:hypothetical protein